MSDERPSSRNPGKKTFLERLGDAFTGEPKDREDLLAIIQEAHQNKILDDDSLRIIHGAMNVSDLHVRDIMIPRSQMACLEHDESVKQWATKVVESGHSRFPVLGESPDEVVGVLLAKDMLALTLKHDFNEEAMQRHVKEIIRNVTFVPESKRVNVLLRDFRMNRNHMAIVVDEYRGISGLVTIEDVLEEIVGEIEDEHDDETITNISSTGNGSYVVQALTPIDDFNDHFATDFSDEEFDTIGGIVMHHFGRVPKRDDTIQIGALEVRVTTADNRRVRSFEVRFVS
ncbi:HlyC/CorC family transporter [Reinekea marinisedimentorum]|uniref:Magnesium and cobalt efflux protein CorC n=1 Tax=Reinekea marinisedimentorum TaxID=230495 RepID=A0A4R3HWE8_9GAMM|nr:transporter associated domain-containing protein [Reinekea marinisedimentorum]TCS37607.1 magnesium and cobalt transporter [Reinekea marinisedimentorum]